MSIFHSAHIHTSMANCRSFCWWVLLVAVTSCIPLWGSVSCFCWVSIHAHRIYSTVIVIQVFLASSRKHIFVACLKEVSKWLYDYLCCEQSMKFVLVFWDPRWSIFVGTVIFSGSPMLEHGSCRWCLSRFTRIFNDPLQHTWGTCLQWFESMTWICKAVLEHNIHVNAQVINTKSHGSWDQCVLPKYVSMTLFHWKANNP